MARDSNPADVASRPETVKITVSLDVGPNTARSYANMVGAAKTPRDVQLIFAHIVGIPKAEGGVAKVPADLVVSLPEAVAEQLCTVVAKVMQKEEERT